MTKYIRKPVIVEAVQWFPELGNSIQDVYIHHSHKYATVFGPGGSDEIVEPGDWCVRGPDLNVQVYDNVRFHVLFEEVFPGINSK
jgi:hypothetical protein